MDTGYRWIYRVCCVRRCETFQNKTEPEQREEVMRRRERKIDVIFEESRKEKYVKIQ